jgi:hypothetical protein
LGKEVGMKRIHFEPKEDITAYELAQIVIKCLGMNQPHEDYTSANFITRQLESEENRAIARHFRIEEIPKEKKAK